MVMAGVVGSKFAADHRLAGEIPVLGVRYDCAPDHLVDMHSVKREAIDETAKGRGQHVEIGELSIGRVRAAERDAHAAKDQQRAASECQP
jgi:hypothetical protein